MLKPCDNCPFRRDKVFPLGEGRRQKIADAILKEDKNFGCHKTTKHDDDGQYVYTHQERPCAGAVYLVEKECKDVKANLSFRLLKYMGRDLSVSGVEVLCDSEEEFVNLEN